MATRTEPRPPTPGAGGVFGKLPSARPGSAQPAARAAPKARPENPPADATPRVRPAADAEPSVRRTARAGPSPRARRRARRPRRPRPPSRRRRVEDLAWAGITVAAEAATLGVRLAEPRRGGGAQARGPPLTPAPTAAVRLTTRAAPLGVARAGLRRYLRAFWHRAYQENITGLAAMVAYNLLLALFPFALLVLFIFGQVLQSPERRGRACSTTSSACSRPSSWTPCRTRCDRIRDSSTTIGVAAAIGALWIGTSFWGAMDTAFCRIYHVECRGWLEQKRFALVMLLVVTLFLAASVVVPTLEGAPRLERRRPAVRPLAHPRDRERPAAGRRRWPSPSCSAALIYYFVPKGHVPWHGVWPGALFVTVTTGIANAVFPFYLANVSSVGEFGGAIGFVLIALVWFYLVSLALMAGAVINALRYELHDTGVRRPLTRRRVAPRPPDREVGRASRIARRSPRGAWGGRGAPAPCGRCPSASA